MYIFSIQTLVIRALLLHTLVIVIETLVTQTFVIQSLVIQLCGSETEQRNQQTASWKTASLKEHTNRKKRRSGCNLTTKKRTTTGQATQNARQQNKDKNTRRRRHKHTGRSRAKTSPNGTYRSDEESRKRK